MSVFEIYKNVISTGDYVLSVMEERIETVFAQGKITAEERAELLRLADKHTPQRLEKVCERALSYSGKPSYKSIKNLLTVMKQEPDTGLSSGTDAQAKPRGITRGARYYGGKRS